MTSTLMTNKTWDLVELPPGRTAIKGKWVYKYKRNGTFKGRWVAKGYSQIYGIDYLDTFAPVAKWDSIRLLLSIGAMEDLEIHQMDVSTAFLNGILNEEIYVEQPEGFIKKGSERLVCRLNKSIYGLKQAPLVWNEHLNKTLLSLNFVRCKDDPCVYIYNDGNNSLIIAIYVDDLLIIGKLLQVEELKKTLQSHYKMTDGGEISDLLGVQITRDRTKRIINLYQESYILKLLNRFNMDECNSMPTPMSSVDKLSKDLSPKTEDEKLEMKNIPYREAVGSLMYLMISSRPDIAYAMGAVSRYLDCPGKQHWHAVKRIMRYIKGTSNYCLQLGGTHNEISILGYTDADYGGDTDTGKSTSGYVFKIGHGVISWMSKKQPTVACSTTEAEYIALWEGAKHTYWLRTLLMELGYLQTKPTIINEDNQGCLTIAKYPKINARTKHINIKFHYIRELIANKDIEVVDCRSEKMLADTMTKPLDKILFQKFRNELGIKVNTISN
jgi:hypothetical protein